MQPMAVEPMQDGLPADDAVWDVLKTHVGDRNFHHWFHHKTSLSISNDELTIGVSSPFLLNWMQKQFRDAIQRTAESTLGPSARIRFVVDATVCEHMQPRNGKPLDEPRKPTSKASRDASPRTRNGGTNRERRFASLTEFEQGPCNELAVTAARQVCECPGARFNPLFVHGGIGTGKTHLLEGTYREIRRQFPALQVMFLTSEAFTNYFTSALRGHTLPSFRQKFRNVDVLLVDDIDFLNGKRVIQEEFLHTFQQLESHGRQIVVTADRHPRLISKLSDELATRFLSGLVCRLEAADLETRQRIVHRKVARLDADITDDALSFVAHRFKNNVRELEGAINCLHTYYVMTRKRVGVAAARKVLSDLERDCIRVVRIADVEQAVCRVFGVEPKQLKSARRNRTISQPRMLAMFLARKHTGAAYNEIGQFFGGRNHSTVVSAEKRVVGWLGDDNPIKIASETWTTNEVVEAIEQQLLAG